MNMIMRRISQLFLLLLLVASFACASAAIGRKFSADPRAELKVGHDQKTDVLRKMGQPYRRFVDSKGHEVFTYVWADGKGGGQKAIIAFNENDVVYLVEVTP